MEELGVHAQSGGLLGVLFTKGLVPQAEVAVTQGLAWLFARAEGGNPLDELIRKSGLVPGPNPTWRAEVMAPDRSRTDLECWWGTDPVPRVVVEAKLHSELTDGQVLTYLTNLHELVGDKQGEALIAVLVPEHRRPEATSLLKRVVEAKASRVNTAVWSYDQVLGALSDALGSSPDLDQLRGLIEVCESLDIRPFTPEEIRTHAAAREADLTRVLDLASASFFTNRSVLPASFRDPDFGWRRYVEVDPAGTAIAVGLRRTPEEAAEGAPWAWIRLHRHAFNPTGAGEVLVRTFPDLAETDAEGAMWLPLTVQPGMAGAALQAEFVRQISRVIDLFAPTVE